MKFRIFAAFFTGLVLGQFLLISTWAAIAPSWKKAAVTPVVICTYDLLYGFRPKGVDSHLAPNWKKTQVTPIVLVGYQSVGNKFVPLNTDATIVPTWRPEAVTPWVEVIPDTLGGFVPLRSR